MIEAGPSDGPLALLLHGFPDTPFGWRGLMPLLAARGYHAVAPWMRGYDPSPLSGPFHVDRIADDAITLVEALSPRRPARIVGHDWGALATWAALAKAPERFSHAVIASVPHPQALLPNFVAHPGQFRRSWYMGFFQLGRWAERVVAADDFAWVHRLWSTWSPGFRPPDDYVAELERCLAASLPAPLEYYRALLRPFGPALARARVHRPVDVPVVYLHGQDDGCIAVEMARGQERFCRAGLVSHVVPGAGHFVPLEQPQALADLSGF